jgi:hypothetical protein
MDAQQAAVAGLACFACACASPAVYVRVRCWAQGPALRLVHAGVPTVLAVQRFDARALTLLFDATAFSVSVPFYGVSLPLLAWVRRLRRARACNARMKLARAGTQVGDLVLVRKLSMLMTCATPPLTLCCASPVACAARLTRSGHSGYVARQRDQGHARAASPAGAVRGGGRTPQAVALLRWTVL